jgi:DNA modification methylase
MIIMTQHTIYFGDSAAILKTIPKETFQLMVTSPPYWNVRDYGHKKQIGYHDTLEQYLSKLNDVWKETVRTLLPDGKIALNIGNIYYSKKNENRRTTANLSYLIWKQLDNYKELRFMGTIYWRKTTSRAGSVLFGSYPYPTNFMISSAVEPIHIFRKIGSRKVSQEIKERSKVTLEEFRNFRDTIWDINGVEDKHCAAYPFELPYRLIKMFTYVGDTVLDPFVGSGTTIKASRDLNRNSVGMDINPKFLPIIEEKVRMRQKTLAGDTEFKVINMNDAKPKISRKVSF